ncbi:IPT/TIG domain-containing protein [Streptomyces sp. PSRA5]|uniref:IPT/TIG domain-containing protein n=1 Tax=Streptomyces panacea TaxID=3035064 RepID=UPI00339BEF50
MVTSATATRLVVTVPAGAGNGKVSVTTGGATVQSPESFTLAAPAPSITTVAPASGIAGATVTLTGGRFATALTDNVVGFGGGIVVRVTVRTATTLVVEVPPGGHRTGRGRGRGRGRDGRRPTAEACRRAPSG